MASFDNPETWEPGSRGDVDFEDLVVRQIERCRQALNKPVVTGYKGSAQLHSSNDKYRTSRGVVAERWVHGTNQKANSAVETLHDLLLPYHDDKYKEEEDSLQEDAVNRLASFLETFQDRVTDESSDYSWNKVLKVDWPVKTRPLIRRRYKSLLRLCERHGLIGGVKGEQQRG